VCNTIRNRLPGRTTAGIYSDSFVSRWLASVPQAEIARPHSKGLKTRLAGSCDFGVRFADKIDDLDSASALRLADDNGIAG
jgi:hypothetical protein